MEEVKMTNQPSNSPQEEIMDISTPTPNFEMSPEQTIQKQEMSLVQKLRLDSSQHQQKYVFQALDLRDNHEYAVKVFMSRDYLQYKIEVSNYQMIRISTNRLVSMLETVDKNQIKHPLVYEGQQYWNYSYIVMPYYENGTLLDLIMKSNKRQIKMSPQLQNYLWQECLKCARDLTVKNLLSHLDLKPDNFIIDNDYHLRLIDFGHTIIYDQPSDSLSGTPNYMAPEIHQRDRRKYIPWKVDIFNLGVILHIILFRQAPFQSTRLSDNLYKYIRRGDFNAFFSIHRASGYPMDGLNLIWDCLKEDPDDRCKSIDYLLEHPITKFTNPNSNMRQNTFDEMSFFLNSQ
ncbi:protein kinase domain containing protein [Stylonychia lemnae]|uniref:Protein kinase domain containing protein n=1 Tax=Stylonychia lemnae TaxID=5949 RepID=A0A078B1Z6_STYLE|nr:protein kinase domain containing protein [Stylonychia lemnae]|eukprot:CDW88301.1 protein kinase domain containing protein [Stylonychia lemnae]